MQELAPGKTIYGFLIIKTTDNSKNFMSYSNTTTLDIDFIRKQFPALQSDFIFMDNAGGSQTLGSVINRISDYLINYNVQPGASYKISDSAVRELESSVEKIANFINADRPEEVIIGPSSSMLLRILSICLSGDWVPGDEIIVSNSDHEANVSCWTDLSKLGFVIKTWNINKETLEFDIEDLKNLLSNKTKLVAMVHTSNIIGTINPISEISKIVHDNGSLFCVDGVAYAPHRLIDVQKFDVDFYAFSFYKVYGPHLAMLYGKYELLREMEGINHYFVRKDEVPYKFQPGNFNYELTYSLPAITDYFSLISDQHFQEYKKLNNRDEFSNAFNLIAGHEQLLADYLLEYLNNRDDIKIIGNKTGNKNKRVPTISFVHSRYKSSDVVRKVDDYNIGIRYGDFYAKKIIEYLGLEEKDGVIRVSLVHYNTIEEVKSLINAFEQIL